MQFVTLTAEEKAGGAVRTDLFSNGQDGVFIDDVPLLESLAAKKLCTEPDAPIWPKNSGIVTVYRRSEDLRGLA